MTPIWRGNICVFLSKEQIQVLVIWIMKGCATHTHMQERGGGEEGEARDKIQSWWWSLGVHETLLAGWRHSQSKRGPGDASWRSCRSFRNFCRIPTRFPLLGLRGLWGCTFCKGSPEVRERTPWLSHASGSYMAEAEEPGGSG